MSDRVPLRKGQVGQPGNKGQFAKGSFAEAEGHVTFAGEPKVPSRRKIVAPEEGFKRLEESGFYREHGHINVPYSGHMGSWKAGQWVMNLRVSYRAGRLSPEAVKGAEELGIVWNPHAHRLTVDGALDRLERSDFYREHGHINVPLRQDWGDWHAGHWLMEFRRKHREGKLSPAEIQRAEKLGIVWKAGGTKVGTDEGLDRLERLAREGRDVCALPKSLSVNGWHPRRWVDNLKRSYNRGTLSSQQVRRAENIGVRF